MSKKILIREYLDYLLEIDNEDYEIGYIVNIKDLEKFIYEAKNNNATHILIDSETGYEGEQWGYDLKAYKIREETDEEHKKRINDEQNNKLKSELDKYEKIKKEYYELKNKLENK